MFLLLSENFPQILFRDNFFLRHTFRNPSIFKDRSVVVVGAGNSAEDVALNSVKFGASSITVSYR